MSDREREMAAYSRDTVLRAAIVWGAEVGPAGFRKLLARFGSAQAILEAGPEDLSEADPRLTAEQIEALTRLAPRGPEFAEYLARLRESGVDVVSSRDEDYPQGLLALRNPPPLLCIRGRILPEDDVAVAIVGTRSPNRDDVERTYALARLFAAERITVVSGLALGVDSAAHRGALMAGGRTLAALGSGIRRVYPAENADLVDGIAEAGAVLSELAPTSGAVVGTLMARNRLIAALARAVVVVASGIGGGSLVTAEWAQKQGKPVAAVDWEKMNPKRLGNRQLLAEGAFPLANDVHVRELCDLIRRSHPSQSQTHETPDHDTHDEGDQQLTIFD